MTEDAHRVDSTPEEVNGYSDYTGDRVYDYLSTMVLSNFRLLGGKLVMNAVATPKEPRVVISLALLNLKTNKRTYPEYNYKRIERELVQKARKVKYAKN